MKWEYLLLGLSGHRADIWHARNMVVTTSDGTYSDRPMRTNVVQLLNELGEAGWELIPTGSGPHAVPMSTDIWAVETTYILKRPKRGA